MWFDENQPPFGPGHFRNLEQFRKRYIEGTWAEANAEQAESRLMRNPNPNKPLVQAYTKEQLDKMLAEMKAHKAKREALYAQEITIALSGNDMSMIVDSKEEVYTVYNVELGHARTILDVPRSENEDAD